MGEPACWGPFVPAPPLSMDGTVSMTCAKSKPLKRTGGGEEKEGEVGILTPHVRSSSGTVDLCPMTPGCPESVPCVNAGTASSAAFLSRSYPVVVSKGLPLLPSQVS